MKWWYNHTIFPMIVWSYYIIVRFVQGFQQFMWVWKTAKVPASQIKQTNKHEVSNNFEEFLIKILSRSQCATWLIARRRLASKKKHVAAYDSMQRRMPKRAHARMLDFARQFLEFVPPGLPRIRTTNMWCSASKTKVSTTRPNIFRNCICSIFWDIFEIKCPAVFDILL